SGTAGTFTPQTPGSTTENIAFSGLDLTGVTAYQNIVNGSNFGSQVSTAPTSPISLTGLTPNTQYTFKIQLFEATCSFIVPVTNATFTTTPVDPTSFTLSAASPFSLNAGWATGANPAGTIYQVQYCTDAGFTQNCQTKNSSAGATSTTLTTGVNPATTYFAHVRALTIGGGLDS